MCRALLVLLLSGCATPAPQTPPTQPAPPPEPTFSVQLHRPLSIGHVQRRHTTMTLGQSHVITSGDAVLEQRVEEVQVTFVAREKILDIDAQGSATKSEYVVEEAFAESQAGRSELLPAGAVLLVSRGVDEPLTLAEGRLTPEAEDLLGHMISTSAPSRTDDEIFGTSEPQPVGGRWPMDGALAAEDLAASGLAVEALTGEVELAAVETVAGTECLRVAAKMTADSFVPARVPAGDVIEKARLEASFEGLFPTDVARHRASDSSRIAAELVVVRHVEGTPVQTQTRVQRNLENIYSEM